MSNVTRMPSQNWSGSWPPGCSCGCNPCQCGGGWGGLMQCWQDLSQFQQFLQCMLSQAGPISLQGVTDGSDAKPGYIGEFVNFTSGSLSFPTTSNTQTISIGVLSPGDWDCWANTTDMDVHDATMTVNPQPTGFSSDMYVATGSAAELVTLVSPMVRASLTVPTLVPIQLVTNQFAAAATASGCIIGFSARRVR